MSNFGGTGDNLKAMGKWRTYQARIPRNAKLKSTIAMTSFSSAITQAGMRRSEEARKQLGRGMAEASSFIGLGPTNGNIVAMHAILMEMGSQAAASVQKFGAAAKKHKLPSVTIRGKVIPPTTPSGAPNPDYPPPPKSNLPLMLGIGAAVVVIVVLLMNRPPLHPY